MRWGMMSGGMMSGAMLMGVMMRGAMRMEGMRSGGMGRGGSRGDAREIHTRRELDRWCYQLLWWRGLPGGWLK